MNSRGVDRDRWVQLTIFEQMGNIGSEVGRAIAAKRNGKITRMDGAIDRAIDLFDATAEVWALQRSPKTREVLRAKEQFLSLFFDSWSYEGAEGIEHYFMHFAQAARMHSLSE